MVCQALEKPRPASAKTNTPQYNFSQVCSGFCAPSICLRSQGSIHAEAEHSARRHQALLIKGRHTLSPLVKRLLKELQSSIGFYEVQTGQSIGHVFCTQLPANFSWLGATMAGALGVPQLKIDLMPWLESLHITLTERVASNPPDERWVGLFSLIASYENAVPDEKK